MSSPNTASSTNKKSFADCTPEQREKLLLKLSVSEKKEEKERESINLNISTNIVPTLNLHEKILMYYKSNRPYLSSKFRVDDLANELETTQKEISQTLKQYYNLNFSSFTNKYRVEAARKMFEDPAYHHIKMEVIAEQSGFGTIQSFYNAFESFTGVKPGYYRTQIATNKS